VARMSEAVRLLLSFVLSGVSVMIVAAVMPGMRVKRFFDAVAFSVVVAILNMVTWHYLWPLSATFSILTAGIGILIINGFIFLLAKKVVSGVEISGCFVAAIASVLVSVVNSTISALLR
jgi:putative membrane protein